MYNTVNGLRGLLLLALLVITVFACHPHRKTVQRLPPKVIESTKTTTERPSFANEESKPKTKSKLRESIVALSQSCCGIDYKYAGKDRAGFDCSGFTSYVLKQFKIEAGASSREQALQGNKIPVNQTRPGDLIFFGAAGKITHVAMVVSNTIEGIVVVHSTSSKGVIVQNISKSSYWKPKILFARDLVGG